MGGSSSTLLPVKTEGFKESDRAPSFGYLIGDRGTSEPGTSIFSDNAPPSLTDIAPRDTSECSSNQNLYEVKFEEANSSTPTFKEIYADHGKRTSTLSFESSSAPQTQSLDIFNKATFRVERIDDEFDEIYKSLVLSEPEDFAISEVGSEVHRGGSLPSSSRFRRSPRTSAIESPDNDFSQSFGSKISFSDDETDDGWSTLAEDGFGDERS